MLGGEDLDSLNLVGVLSLVGSTISTSLLGVSDGQLEISNRDRSDDLNTAAGRVNGGVFGV